MHGPFFEDEYIVFAKAEMTSWTLNFEVMTSKSFVGLRRGNLLNFYQLKVCSNELSGKHAPLKHQHYYYHNLGQRLDDDMRLDGAVCHCSSFYFYRQYQQTLLVCREMKR